MHGQGSISYRQPVSKAASCLSVYQLHLLIITDSMFCYSVSALLFYYHGDQEQRLLVNKISTLQLHNST